MRRTGTDLMATGVIVGSTALAVAATLAFTRANSEETQDSTAECTPLEARWAVTYAVTVDGDAKKSTPVKWRLHTGFQAPRASHGAAHRCRHLTVVAPRMKLISDRLTLELSERRRLQETVQKQLEANSAGER